MNFFKKVLGYSPSLPDLIQTTKIQATFYRVIKDSRNIILQNCLTHFHQDDGSYYVQFSGQKSDGEATQYAFPIHQEMQLVTFMMNKGGKQNTCFQWSLDENKQHIGCYMDPSDKAKFKQIICLIMKEVLNDQLIKDHLKLCRELNGIPVYKQNTESSQISSSNSKISKKSVQAQLNEVLVNEAHKQSNKMVNSASFYETYKKERELVNQAVVFVLRETAKFKYEIQIINATGYTFLKQPITPELCYEVNTNLSYFKWFNVGENKIYELNFNDKIDVALSIKFAIQQCLYEYNSQKKITDAVAQDQLSYLKRISGKYEAQNKKIVKEYSHKQDITEIDGSKIFYQAEGADKGLEKYRTFSQAKIYNFDLASLGSMIETLKISEDNQIKQVSKNKLPQYKGEELEVDSILLGDKDSKAMLNDHHGRLHYYDIETGKIVNNYELSRAGIQDICHEYKLAETDISKTYKAISPNTIYEVDPRMKQGYANLKSYKTNTEFNRIAVDCKGRFACSSQNGQIRLFNQIGKNANCKYPGFGDPVLHLQSTKDGKWLLATFKTYLLLIPTETQEEVNLYDHKIKINERPTPIRLSIKLEHLQLCGVKDYTLIPAKFDESKDRREMFIVSGFESYAVIWNLSQVIKGQLYNYKFTKGNGELIQTDFMYGNYKKMIMTTTNGITINANKTQ